MAALLLLAGAAMPQARPTPIKATGCVQAGVEARCLVLKDAKTGKLYNLLVKDPRPAAGQGISFTGIPFDGMTTCMQGEAVQVTHWEHAEGLKCAAAPAQ